MCVGDIYSPREMVSDTIGWRELGMPDELIAFVSDGSDNKFCFDKNRLKEGGEDTSTVWLFDHEFGTVEEVAPSFDAWIDAFCDVAPWPGTELG